MIDEFKFIHAADIHLGSIIHGDSDDAQINEALCEGVYNSFRKITELAINNKVDFVVLSGDIFDSEIKPVKAKRVFYEEAVKLNDNNISLYYISGNHDPYSEEIQLFSLPPNVHYFNHEQAEENCFEKDGYVVARIIGQSYKNKWDKRKMFKDYLIQDNSTFNIGVLHTSLEEDGRYVPSTINELKKVKNIDYWALGHVHKKRVLNSEPYIVYPGNPQGRDIGEQGIGSCYLVSVDKEKKCNLEELTTSSVAFEVMEINVEGLGNLNEIELKVIDELEKKIDEASLQQSYVVNLNFVGETELDEELRADSVEIIKIIKESINNNFKYSSRFIIVDDININTKKDFINREEIIRESEVLTQLNLTIEDILEDQMAMEDLKKELGAIFDNNLDEEVVDEEKFKLTDELTRLIIEEAKEKIIYQFLEWSDLD